jgi:hypothetical protein
MRFKLVPGLVAAGAISMICAVDAQAADVRGYEVRPGLPGIELMANAGERNDVKLVNKPDGSVSSPGGLTNAPMVGGHVVTVIDNGSTLTTGGDNPCRLLSPHRARCVSSNGWQRIDLFLQDGPDRVRMPSKNGYPTTDIYANGGGGNRYTLRGPSTFVQGAFTGDRVTYRPPGGGGVIVAGSPRVWLIDGASESVECHTDGSPRIFTDPLDTVSYCQ